VIEKIRAIKLENKSTGYIDEEVYKEKQA